MPELTGRPRGQVEIVTILRGLAASSVFLFHLVCVTHGYIPGDAVHAFFSYGKFGVQFFFVISGFVIPYSMIRANYRTSDFFRFLVKRVVRIQPPYLLLLAQTVSLPFARSRPESEDPLPLY